MDTLFVCLLVIVIGGIIISAIIRADSQPEPIEAHQHEWSKWLFFVTHEGIAVQSRECMTCGFTQMEKVDW